MAGGDPADYPDRAAWPAYWTAIRTAIVWVLAAVVIICGGTLLPRPDGLAARLAMEALIGLILGVVGTFLAARVNAWWERRRS